MWYGEGPDQDHHPDKDDSHMSKLRQSFLEFIRILGNHSGCHQLPERSFFYKTKQFPVCARCTGVFAGQVLALITGLFGTVHTGICLLFLAVMGSDWGIQALKIKESTNLRRFITGILGGFGLFSIYIKIFKDIKKLLCNLK